MLIKHKFSHKIHNKLMVELSDIVPLKIHREIFAELYTEISRELMSRFNNIIEITIRNKKWK